MGGNLRDFAQNFSHEITSHPMSETQTFDLTIGATRLTVILGDTEQLGRRYYGQFCSLGRSSSDV